MNSKIFFILIAMIIQNNAFAQIIGRNGKRSPEVQTEYALELCKHLHQNPELSFQEFESAKRMAAELKKAGFEVTEKWVATMWWVF
jgi:metal-dependent amidase/aminoacylase/carboxypeptidase family protein